MSNKINALPAATSTAQRQADYRARKAAAALHEVRGVFLPRELHAKLKELARGLLAK